MKIPKNDIERLQNLEDALAESIIKASDEEIIQDFEQDGKDHIAAAESTRAILASHGKLYRQKKLKTAKENYERWSTSRTGANRLPSNPEDCRSLLAKLLSAHPELSNNKLTLAFRQARGNEISDEDVKSMLEDLNDLGYLNNDSSK